MISDRDALLNAAFASREDDAPRLIAADWFDEHVEHAIADYLRNWPLIDDGGSGSGDGGDGGGSGDGGDGGSGSGSGDGTRYAKEVPVENGLYILSIPSGWNPYVLVGWVEIDGMLLTIRNCCCIRRFGQNKSLSELAIEGPAPDTQILSPSAVEYIWRQKPSRNISAVPSKWKKHCPKPTIEGTT